MPRREFWTFLRDPRKKLRHASRALFARLLARSPISADEELHAVNLSLWCKDYQDFGNLISFQELPKYIRRAFLREVPFNWRAIGGGHLVRRLLEVISHVVPFVRMREEILVPLALGFEQHAAGFVNSIKLYAPDVINDVRQSARDATLIFCGAFAAREYSAYEFTAIRIMHQRAEGANAVDVLEGFEIVNERDGRAGARGKARHAAEAEDCIDLFADGQLAGGDELLAVGRPVGMIDRHAGRLGLAFDRKIDHAGRIDLVNESPRDDRPAGQVREFFFPGMPGKKALVYLHSKWLKLGGKVTGRLDPHDIWINFWGAGHHHPLKS